MTINNCLFEAQIKCFLEDVLSLARPIRTGYKVYLVCNGFKKNDVVDMLISVDSGIPYKIIEKASNTGGISSLGDEGLKKYMVSANKLADEYQIFISEEMPSTEELNKIEGDAYVIFVMKYPHYIIDKLPEQTNWDFAEVKK